MHLQTEAVRKFLCSMGRSIHVASLQPVQVGVIGPAGGTIAYTAIQQPPPPGGCRPEMDAESSYRFRLADKENPMPEA